MVEKKGLLGALLPVVSHPLLELGLWKQDLHTVKFTLW